MSKLPYTQFYVADWLSDTAPLSAQARGVWIDLICFLWRAEPRGRLTYSKEVWCRLLRVDQSTLSLILEEFAAFKICNVSGNEPVTIESRRIVREEKKRENNRFRVDKWRSNKDSNAPVMPPVMPSNASSNGENQSQKQKQKQNQSRPALHAALPDRTSKSLEPLTGLGEAVRKFGEGFKENP